MGKWFEDPMEPCANAARLCDREDLLGAHVGTCPRCLRNTLRLVYADMPVGHGLRIPTKVKAGEPAPAVKPDPGANKSN